MADKMNLVVKASCTPYTVHRTLGAMETFMHMHNTPLMLQYALHIESLSLVCTAAAQHLQMAYFV